MSSVSDYVMDQNTEEISVDEDTQRVSPSVDSQQSQAKVGPSKRGGGSQSNKATKEPSASVGRPAKKAKKVGPKEKGAKKEVTPVEQSVVKCKEEDENDPDFIRLTVKSMASEEMFLVVRIRRTSKFEKLIQTFCTTYNLDQGESRFLYDGVRLHGTPAELGMVNDDIIEVNVKQVGGNNGFNSLVE